MLLNGLIKSTKLKNLELSIGIKRKYEVENPIDWELGHCCIYKFPLKINPTNFDATVNNMSHPNFIISREYKVLKILSFWTRAVIKRITKKHWRISQKVSKIFENDYFLPNSLTTTADFSKCYDDKFIDFCDEFCADCCDFAEIKERILDVTIKNKQGTKILKMTLQVYAFVYQRLMDFPQRQFDHETLTTNEHFDLVHKIINVKTYLNHSHITGKIIGYAHDFWKTKVRENKDVLTFIAHVFSVLTCSF